MFQELKARIQLKHETEQVWKNTTNFIPMLGEMIVYDVDDNHNYERFKIGDGVRNVNELPFNEPNWNAASGEPGYILNKPNFLEEKIFFEEEWFQKINNEQYGEVWVYYGDNIKYPIVGKSYTVVYNDIPYNCTCKLPPAGIVNDPNAVVMGNFSIISGPDTGEPFAMLFSELNNNIIVMDLIESNSVKIKIYEQQIKTNIIPDMYYTEESKILLEHSNNSTISYIYGDNPLKLDPTITYKVIWNGNEYKCKPGIAVIGDGVTAQFLGDIYTYSEGQLGTSPTGEPFALIVDIFGPGNIIGIVYQASNELYTIAVLQDEINHKIDSKYLPSSVPIAEKIVLLENTAADVFEGSGWDNSYIIEKKIQPIVGKRYVINFNGVPYECECKIAPPELGLISTDAVVMGNFSVIGGPGTGEPFALMISSSSQIIVILNLSESSSVYLEIYENKIQKLNEKCLPDGYPYISSGIIVEETVTIDEESGQGLVTEKFNLVKNESYTVNWNEVEYSCIAKDFMLGDSLETIALGNTAALDGSGESTDEPFAILYLSEALQSQLGAYGILIALDGSTEVALSISGKIVHKMSKDLLPEIGMLNIKDGDNGSIRGTFTAGAMGSIATAIGYQTMALGDFSYAEGYSDYNIQDSITAETTLEEILEERRNGNYFTLAFGQASHAEGYNTLAYGEYSHAEGYSTIASGSNSHAEGWDTMASGERSHTEGLRTIASGDYQHVQGAYNKRDDTSVYAHIVGNGTSDASRSNAHTLDWDGNAWFAGNIKIGGIDQNDVNAKTLATTNYVDTQIAAIPTPDVSGQISAHNTDNTAHADIRDLITGLTTRLNALADSDDITLDQMSEIVAYINTKAGKIVAGKTFTIEGETVIANSGAEIFNSYDHNIATGSNSHAEGYATTASGPGSHAEGYGTTASGNYSHTEGNETTASGNCSHTEGYGTTASGNYSHTEGNETTASGYCSHTEGSHTTASGSCSHAEGYNTTAADPYSHAEGNNTTASGFYSHAEGYATSAHGQCQHVQGRYNITLDDNYLHIVGNGRTEDTRSNAHTIDQAGGAWFAGDVYVGSTSGTNKDTGSKKLVAAPNNMSAGDLLMYDGTTFTKLSKADLIAEIIAALPRAEEASF